MARYTKLGTDLVVGGVGGVANKVVEDWDGKRATAAPGGKLTFFQRGSTYLNFGVPLLGIVGSLVGFLHGDWETRAITVGGVLAGREATTLVKQRTVTPWRPLNPGGGNPGGGNPNPPGFTGRSAWKPTGLTAT